MMKSMGLGAWRELQAIIKQKYHNASWTESMRPTPPSNNF